MKGCRPLTQTEIDATLRTFSGRYALRDRALLITGLFTGFRITELLSLNIGDVYQKGKLLDSVAVHKRNIKGKTAGRTVKLNPRAKAALAAWLGQLMSEQTDPDCPVFCVMYKGRQRMSRRQAWSVLHEAFDKAELTGKLGTHAMRKTFALRIYKALDGKIEKVQVALGHKFITSTVAYVPVHQEEIDSAIDGLE